MKCFEMAREGWISNNQVKIICAEMGEPLKSHMSIVPDEIEVEIRERFKDEIAKQEPKPKKQMTSPWNQSDNPWSIDMLKLPKKKPGFHAKFSTEENMTKRLQEGWVIADKKDWGVPTAQLPGEESKGGTVIRRRELVLIEITDELYQKRKEFMDYKTNKRAQDARNIAKSKVRQIEKEAGTSIEFSQKYDSRQA